MAEKIPRIALPCVAKPNPTDAGEIVCENLRCPLIYEDGSAVVIEPPAPQLSISWVCPDGTFSRRVRFCCECRQTIAPGVRFKVDVIP